jgi:hypothetical protein
VRIRFLYKTNVEDIVSGLKANDPINDWVLRHTKEEEGFWRIARMISCFGQTVEQEAEELGFEAVNMDSDFATKIANFADGLTAD